MTRYGWQTFTFGGGSGAFVLAHNRQSISWSWPGVMLAEDELASQLGCVALAGSSAAGGNTTRHPTHAVMGKAASPDSK